MKRTKPCPKCKATMHRSGGWWYCSHCDKKLVVKEGE